MKKTLLILSMCSLIIGTSCKNEKKENTNVDEATEMNESEVTPAIEEVKKLQISLESKSDSQATGNVIFTQEDGTVNMVAMVEGLSEGTHAIHIHEKADCSAADGTSTGGHWNPTNQPHGKWGAAEGYHKGDIGNLEANANGKATITIKTEEWCIGCGDANKDILGKAIIVHAGTDDFKTQPTGDAGGRISCGGIIE